MKGENAMSEVNQVNEDFLTEEEQKFVVDNDHAAEWVIQKRIEAENEYEGWKKFYKEQSERAKVRFERRKAWALYLLNGYFRTVPHKKSATQESYQLPSGKLVLKDQGPEYIHDDEALGKWLVERGMDGLVEFHPSVNWREFTKVMKAQGYGVIGGNLVTPEGEIVPGVKVIEREPVVFNVEGLKK